MDEKLPQRGFTFDSPGLPTIGGYLGNDASKNATPLGVVLSFCSNQTAFIGVDHANKKGSYLLSRIALFDKVYHRTDWGVEGKQKKRPFDCSNERFCLKKGSYLLSRIALFDKVYHWTNWGVKGKQKSTLKK